MKFIVKDGRVKDCIEKVMGQEADGSERKYWVTPNKEHLVAKIKSADELILADGCSVYVELVEEVVEEPKPTSTSTVAEIKIYLDAMNIPYTSKMLKPDLLDLVV